MSLKQINSKLKMYLNNKIQPSGFIYSYTYNNEIYYTDQKRKASSYQILNQNNSLTVNQFLTLINDYFQNNEDRIINLDFGFSKSTQKSFLKLVHDLPPKEFKNVIYALGSEFKFSYGFKFINDFFDLFSTKEILLLCEASSLYYKNYYSQNPINSIQTAIYQSQSEALTFLNKITSSQHEISHLDTPFIEILSLIFPKPNIQTHANNDSHFLKFLKIKIPPENWHYFQQFLAQKVHFDETNLETPLISIAPQTITININLEHIAKKFPQFSSDSDLTIIKNILQKLLNDSADFFNCSKIYLLNKLKTRESSIFFISQDNNLRIDTEFISKIIPTLLDNIVYELESLKNPTNYNSTIDKLKKQLIYFKFDHQIPSKDFESKKNKI